MNALRLYRGDTFSRAIRFRRDGVNPTDLVAENITIKSQIRRKDNDALVAELRVTVRDQDTQTGVAVLTADGDTNLWPVGELVWDVLYCWPSDEVDIAASHTDTMTLKVARSVTR